MTLRQQRNLACQICRIIRGSVCNIEKEDCSILEEIVEALEEQPTNDK
jgi:hypothetical protein